VAHSRDIVVVVGLLPYDEGLLAIVTIELGHDKRCLLLRVHPVG